VTSDNVKRTVTDEIANTVKAAVKKEMENHVKKLNAHTSKVDEVLHRRNRQIERFFTFDSIQQGVFWAGNVGTVLLLIWLFLVVVFGVEAVMPPWLRS